MNHFPTRTECRGDTSLARIIIVILLLAGLTEADAQIGPGQALQFDGVAAQVQVSSNALLTLSNQLTLEAWIHPQKQDCNTILSSGTGLNPSTDTIFDIGWNGSSCGTEMKVGLCISGWYYSASHVPLNTWTHIAVTCDGATVRFFINGVLDSTTPQTTSVSQTGLPLYLARQGDDCNCNFFQGPMDEVRIWNVARAGSDISASMQHTLGGTEPGLVAYYRFDESSGTTAGNSAATGSDNEGTLVNGPASILSGVPFAPDIVTPPATFLANRVSLNAFVNSGNLPTKVFFVWGVLPYVTIPTATNSLPGINGSLNVSIPLSGPTPPTTWSFFVVAENSAGSAIGDLSQFLITPYTDSATEITTNSATLNGFVDPNNLATEVYFEWGTTTKYGSFSPTNTLADTAPAGSVSMPLDGLAPDSIYHYRIVSSNSSGTSYGCDVAFLTATTISGTWTPLANAPPGQVGPTLLLSDGTVIAENVTHGSGSGWFRLTPDIHGSYVDGTWSTNISPMHARRGTFGSTVLRDGRVLVAGGEYGTGPNSAETYDPLTDTWTLAPDSASLSYTILDANTMLLPDGRVLVGIVNPLPVDAAANGYPLIYDPVSNAWAKAGYYARGVYSPDETSWVKLPDDSILMVDQNRSTSERYVPAIDRWIPDADVPVELWNLGELGPAIILPNGKVFCLGGNGHTAIYTPSGTTNAGSWTVGADLPNSSGVMDAPAAMMVNGKILCAVSQLSGEYLPPTTFYEYDYLSNSFALVSAPGAGTALAVGASGTVMLDLPDGSVLFSSYDKILYVYRPVGSPLAAGKPTIAALTTNADGSYHLTGTLFNGISAGASYGDDLQNDSNYPLVRLTNSFGQVFYCRTYNWSRTSVMTGTNLVSTEFALPRELPLDNYGLVVVANGIASDPIPFSAGITFGISPKSNFLASGLYSGPFSPAAQSYTLTNRGTAPLNWTVGTTSTWLNVSLTSGTLPLAGAVNVTLSPNGIANSLYPGSYQAALRFTNLSSGYVLSRSFTLQVEPVEQKLLVDPKDDFAASGFPSGPFNPSAQSYVLTNSGATALDWAAATASAWLNVSPPNGTLPPGGVVTVTLSPNAAANLLGPGEYTALVAFSDLPAAYVESRNFTLQIQPSFGFVPDIDFQASGHPGGPFHPTAHAYVLTNSGVAPVTWSLGTTSSWLSVSPAAGSIPPGFSTNIIVGPGPTGNSLPVGEYLTTFWFTNLSDGIVLSHTFTLDVAIVENGGFENYDPSTYSPYGWSLVSGNVTNNLVVVNDPLFAEFAAHSGDAWMIFAEPNQHAVLQQILPTVPGTAYLLSFWLADFTTNTSPYFGVSWNGSFVYQATNLPPMGWTHRDFLVTASGSISMLDFAAQAEPFVGPGSGSVVELDDVSLTPVPAARLHSVAAAGTMAFAWNALPGLNYQLQYKTNLTQSSWLNLGGPISATNSIMRASDTVGPDRARFYRLMLAP